MRTHTHTKRTGRTTTDDDRFRGGGKLYLENTEAYWKKLDQTIEEYLVHPESKFENGNRSGIMRRTHLTVKSIHIIGKEFNELEILGLDEPYVDYLPSKSR